MLSRSLQMMLLFAAVVTPLAGCIIVPNRHRDHGYYGRGGYGPPPEYYGGY